jgi:hypothetical protein
MLDFENLVHWLERATTELVAKQPLAKFREPGLLGDMLRRPLLQYEEMAEQGAALAEADRKRADAEERVERMAELVKVAHERLSNARVQVASAEARAASAELNLFLSHCVIPDIYNPVWSGDAGSIVFAPERPDTVTGWSEP